MSDWTQLYRDFLGQFSAFSTLTDESQLLREIDQHFKAGSYDRVVQGLHCQNLKKSQDPILAVLSGRAAQLASTDRPAIAGLVHEERFSAFVVAVREVLRLEMMLSQFTVEPEDSPALEAFHTNLYVIRQFSLFHLLREGEAQARDVTPWEMDWLEYDFHRFNDYTGVHPFVMALCPPRLVWRRYISDGILYQVDMKGGLEAVALVHPEGVEDRVFPISYPYL